jgi:hypothetical protein
MDWAKRIAVYQEIVEIGRLSASLDAHWRMDVRDEPYFRITVYSTLDRDALKRLVAIAETHDLAVEINDRGEAVIDLPRSG